MERTIKLLRIAAVPDDRCGGMSRTMHLTTDHLQRSGFEVRHVFLDGFKWKVHRGLARFTQPWEAGLRMDEAIRNWGGCDLVEVHEPLTPGCVWERRRFPGCRIVGFSYGVEERARKAMLGYRKNHGICTPMKGRLTSLLQSWHSTAGLRGCDHVICSNSEDMSYLESKGISKSKLTRHFSGVDEQMLASGAASEAVQGTGILFIGAWIDRKGTREIAAAVSRVLRSRPDIHFTAAGCQIADNQVLNAFPEDIRGRVRTVRRMESEEELAELYNSHAIFFLPSYFEGQPLVMMEAAAFGMAIVVTATCGMLDFVRDSENGLLVPVGDAKACEDALLRLAGNPTLRQRLGEAARRDVESHTWRESARNLAETYRRVVGREP